MKSFVGQSDVLEILAGLGASARAFWGKTVLLTGGMGFIGRYFTALFQALNETKEGPPCRLLILDNLITSRESGAQLSKVPATFEFLRHDVTKLFRHNGPIDFIIHAAGIASPFYYKKYPLETLEVAVWGTKHMLDLAKEHRARMLYFSSSEIYGDPDPRYVPTPESYRGNVSCLGPRACYDESKRLGETLCRIYHDYFGASAVIVRPFNVYGPGMSERDYRVLPNFASRIIGGKPLLVYGSGHQTRTFCYVTDAVRGFLLALVDGLPGEAYNIGNDRPEVGINDLVQYLEAFLGRKLEVNRIEYPDSYPPDEPQRRCPEISKARIQLGFEPQVGLEEGLRRFIRWTEGAYGNS